MRLEKGIDGGTVLEQKISASLLSADMLHLADALHSLKQAGVDMLHFDVMDGCFVPNISFGLPVLKALAKASSLFMDVHLMIEDPCLYVKNFAEAGADMLTFHLESRSDPFRTIQAIHDAGCQAGISLKPATPAKALLPFLDELDSILVMTVEPGFGGQSYLTDMTAKIAEVRSMIGTRKILLSADGGICTETAPAAAKAGTDVLVAGSWLFAQQDMREAVAWLRHSGEAAL